MKKKPIKPAVVFTDCDHGVLEVSVRECKNYTKKVIRVVDIKSKESEGEAFIEFTRPAEVERLCQRLMDCVKWMRLKGGSE